MNKKVFPFHTSIESGLRSMMALYEVYPEGMNFERLHYYDYIAVHTADFDGPPSLHAGFPHRTGEYLVRRKLIEEGLDCFRHRGLITLKLSTNGIEYVLTDAAGDYLLSLKKPYLQKLSERICWVHATFGKFSNEKLKGLFSQKINKWDNPLEFQLISKGTFHE
jgi:hypothetical protein